MTSPAVVISPAGQHASIGSANVAAFLPPVAPPPPPGSSGSGGPGGSGTLAPPAATLPAKVTAKSLGSGLGVKVQGLRGREGHADRDRSRQGDGAQGQAGHDRHRQRDRMLKGAELTLRLVQNGRTSTKTVTLR
jgi:hypothetical protein